jgi:hypothetical protein
MLDEWDAFKGKNGSKSTEFIALTHKHGFIHPFLADQSYLEGILPAQETRDTPETQAEPETRKNTKKRKSEFVVETL